MRPVGFATRKHAPPLKPLGVSGKGPSIHSPVASAETTTPPDPWLDTVDATISLDVREMACRLNGHGKNSDKTAANLARIAQGELRGEDPKSLDLQ
jgi:hypothetical protein